MYAACVFSTRQSGPDFGNFLIQVKYDPYYSDIFIATGQKGIRYEKNIFFDFDQRPGHSHYSALIE